MIDERKQELTRLLQEALANLEIRQDSADRHQSIHVNQYRSILQRHWTSYSTNFLSPIMPYEPHIVNGSTKSKLLDFIREEFSEFIDEDHIQSARSCIIDNPYEGYPLDNLLKQLLNIAIVLGVEKVILDFDRCTKNASGSFQYIALLQGIKVEKEIQVFEGTRLVPLPKSTLELPDCLPYNLPCNPVDLLGKTLLVINASISPVFYKPPPPLPPGVDYWAQPEFEVEITGENFSNVNEDNFYSMINFYVNDFYDKFCRALSLTCNSAVQAAIRWQFLAKHELFNLRPVGGSSFTQCAEITPFRGSTVAGETQIDEAKRLYRKMIKWKNVAEKLQIPIDRWIKSKTSQAPEDKIRDWGTALETLYLSEDEKYKRSSKLSKRASWHLGKDQAHRKELMEDFRDIYEWRSTVVHTGKLPKKKNKKPFRPREIAEFTEKVQDLCRDSIMKILKDEKFPVWNDLILGEESLSHKDTDSEVMR